jgi:hypothetical protein
MYLGVKKFIRSMAFYIPRTACRQPLIALQELEKMNLGYQLVVGD